MKQSSARRWVAEEELGTNLTVFLFLIRYTMGDLEYEIGKTGEE